MKRGDLWVASGGDDAGKPRPVPIIQNDQFGQTGSIAVCSVSSNPADSPLLRVVPSPGSENASRKFVVSWPKGSRPFADTAGSEGSAVYPRQIRGGSISAFSSSLASPDEAQAKIVALQILDSAPTSRPCFTRFAVRWQRNAISPSRSLQEQRSRQFCPAFARSRPRRRYARESKPRAVQDAAPARPFRPASSGQRTLSMIGSRHASPLRSGPNGSSHGWIQNRLEHIDRVRCPDSQPGTGAHEASGTQSPPQAGHCPAGAAPGVSSGWNGMKLLARRDRISAANHWRQRAG